MSKEYFVDEHSIGRRIWGKSDTILFIFAGAAAEFALNKAVDWLYLPAAFLQIRWEGCSRLFLTRGQLFFLKSNLPSRSINAIAAIHANVEEKRGASIPDWAYRDVLFMLIDYSIRSFEVLERRLNDAEKEEVFDVFYRVGTGMGLSGLPQTFAAWKQMRHEHLQQDLRYSHYTADLFRQYRKHLGGSRYRILLEVQTLIAPGRVRGLLGFRRISLLYPSLWMYKVSRSMKLDTLLKAAILPAKYKNEIRALDEVPVSRRLVRIVRDDKRQGNVGMLECWNVG